MSKRPSVSGSPASANTLFKYFAKSPAPPAKTPSRNAADAATPAPKTPSDRAVDGGDEAVGRSPSTTANKLLGKFSATPVRACPTGKRLNVDVIKTPKNDASDEDEPIQTVASQAKKRRRIVLASDSEHSDQENVNDADQNAKTAKKPETKPTKKPEPPASARTSHTEHSASSDTNTKTVKPAASKPTPKSGFLDKLSALSDKTKAEPIDSERIDVATPSASNLLDDAEPQQWTHNKIDFIQPANLKDAAGRRPSHPEYDPTTLYVPKAYLDSLSPGMRQWWVLKSTHFDCVLFFKVGKFYELYHMDADVGVAELGFTYMRGEYAHSGFPEQSYDRMAVSLVERGFKVARTEQTETPDMMTERCRNQHKVTKYDKVVCREVCQVTNRGTQVFGQQVPLTQNHQANYMMAVAERHSNAAHRFGVCFIETSLGEFHVGEFDDDRHCSRLLTLLAHHQPVLVLTARGGLSARALQIFKTVLANTLKEQLVPDTQFWSADRTLKTMAEKYLRPRSDGDAATAPIVWPAAFAGMQDATDHLGITAHADARLSLSALGACLWYLSKCLVDGQIMAQARFDRYTPPDDLTADATTTAATVAALEARAVRRMQCTITARHMVLDSISLNNLRCCGAELSLLGRLDQCCTKFGRRLLQHWVCTPSCYRPEVLARQAAVRELMADVERLQRLRELLGQLPDLERQLAQIHTFGNAQYQRDHPNGRAILFEQVSYNRKKIRDFVDTLRGLQRLCEVPKMMADVDSERLRTLTQTEITGELAELLAFFREAFDAEEALRSGTIAPAAGVDAEYDAAQSDIAGIGDELNDYLVRQEKRFGCRIVYYGTDKKRYQLEIPEANARRADAAYQLEGQKKGAKPVIRYHTAETREFLRRMIACEQRRNDIVKDLSRRMFEKFSALYVVWKRCVDAAGRLDVLSTLATYGLDQPQVCFPELVECTEEQGPLLELDDGVHPCLNASNEFIPNGVRLGGGAAPLALLTGPNMGGKSTMMRQIGLLVVMAQMGCPLPAVSCRMTLVDRIFTRLGAHDDIMAGHSTFLVELSETATILRHATRNSLVLLDELGRGTATYDGTAIAAAVVDFMAELGCRTMFSTHYHNLVENFVGDARISLGHMACMVENEGDGDDPTEETVTFLYKYTAGPCPKSYGFNAAKLAGMPTEIIRRAHELSKKVESDALQRKIFSKMLCKPDAGELRGLLANLQKLIVK